MTLAGIRVGKVAGWSFVPEGGGLPRVVERAVRRRIRTRVLEQLHAFVQAPDATVVLNEEGRLSFDGAPLARLEPGPSPLEPKVVLQRLELLEAEERERIRRRLDRWRDGWVERLFAPLEEAPESLSPAARGLLYAVRAGLGTADRTEIDENVRSLTKGDRKALAKLDVRLGTQTVYVASLLRPEAQRQRAQLWSVYRDLRPLAEPPADGRPTLPGKAMDAALARALGYRLVGGLHVRADVLERVAADARRRARQRRPERIETVMSWLGASHDDAVRVLADLGFRVQRRPDGLVSLRGRRR